MIKDMFNKGKTLFSIEVFPPKKDSDVALLYPMLDGITKLSPDFISVTYGAGGNACGETVSIASYIKNRCQIEALAHLTSVSLDRDSLRSIINELKNANVLNILALRGDKPLNMTDEQFAKINREFPFASDMVTFLKNDSDFSIAGACYPEKHYEASSLDEDIRFLKHKVDSGAHFLISQLFFDNEVFYKFYDKALEAGVNIPICTGIMPITSVSQMKTIQDMAHPTIPSSLEYILNKYGNCPNDMKKAGLDYAMNQISNLVDHKVHGIHLYAMNKLDVACTVFEQCRL